MTKKKNIVVILLSLLSVVFLCCALYEGSNLIEDPFDWQESSLFTNLLVSNPKYPEDIIWLDYFVYAVKYYPIYPVLTLISLLGLLLFVMGTKLKSSNLFNVIEVVIGGLMIFTALSFFSANTIGSEIFKYTILLSGLIFIMQAIFIGYKRLKN
jgi:Domain of unknown function (DUF4306)